MTDEHLKALGRVAVNFQALEEYISVWVTGLIGPDQAIGQMVTVQLPFGKLCILANSLFEYKFKGMPFATKFEELIKHSLRLEEQRNQLFHSAWLTDDVSGETSRLKLSLKLGKGLAHTAPPITPQEIGRLADEMKQVATGLGQLISDMTAAGLNKGVGSA
jgi:hypothetical protein